ncbi:MAG: hypothetical protein PHX08_20825, partial [Lachnospiraceae bacterium]|nr:hypothetical protein [Lachnospiraceae bacterium]
MGETINVKLDDIEVVDTEEYYIDAEKSFKNVPTMARPLLENAKRTFSKIEEMLYSAPAFINAIRS